MMRKALSFLGCLLLSIGSVAAEPVNRLSDDRYWFCEDDASTSTNEVGGTLVRTLSTTGDKLVYCTFSPDNTTDSYDDSGNDIKVPDFNSGLHAIPDGSGYFVRLNAKFTPREAPQVTATSDFPYRTLLYVTSDNHLAFLERKEGECAAVEVKTNTVVDDTLGIITVQILKNNTFRVYVGDAEVTVGVDSVKRPYRSLQDGKTGRYHAESFHSFAFIGEMEISSIEFTTSIPFTKTISSIPFSFNYDSAAVTINDPSALPETVEPGQTYTISITRKIDKYTFESPTLSGNAATLADDSTLDTIKFTVADPLTDDNPLVLTLPSKAYFFTLGGKEYGTFDEIITAAQKTEDKKISITCDIDLDSPVSPGAQAYISDGQTLVLDLRGKKIKGGVYRPEADDAAILNRGNLKIIDSVGGGIIEANGFALTTSTREGAVLDTVALENQANKTIIKAGIFNGKVCCNGGTIQIDGGKFYNVMNDETAADFYLCKADGISISAKFANAFIDADNYWQAPSVADGKVLVEFRPDHGTASPATKEYDSIAEVTAAELATIVVTAPGYDVSRITWTKETDDTIYHGSMPVIEYTVSYELGGKGPVAGVPSEKFTVEAPLLKLPVPEDDLWELDSWLLEDSPVTALGDTESTLKDVTLVAKWKPKTMTWTNAMEGRNYLSLTEANGFFDQEHLCVWSIYIPAEKGFSNNDPFVLKSIALTTVNASPNNLKRMPSSLTLSVNNDEYSATPSIDYRSGDSTKFEYFKTNFGSRPKVVYTFENAPTLSVGKSYHLEMAYPEGEQGALLLRLMKKQNFDFNSVFVVLVSESTLPDNEYQSYVPMYEIKGEAK